MANISFTKYNEMFSTNKLGNINIKESLFASKVDNYNNVENKHKIQSKINQ